MTKYIHVVMYLVFLISGSAMAADSISPTHVAGATTVDSSQAKALFDKGAAFVDIREDASWTAGRIPDAIHIELKKAFNETSLGNEVSKDENVIFYCNGHKCLRSSEASIKAVSWGYSKVFYYRDGYPAWKAAGYPVE
ncbi:MAG: rhodanese-like domain-containing protein [Gammaproteobacteria bacterium]